MQEKWWYEKQKVGESTEERRTKEKSGESGEENQKSRVKEIWGRVRERNR